MLGGGGFVFIFHFKHDGDDFGAVFIGLAIDIVTLTAGTRDFVIFFKVGVLETGGAKLVKLSLTMLFQGFTDHFCAEFSFEVFEAVDFLIFELEGAFVFFFEGAFFNLRLIIFGVELGL